MSQVIFLLLLSEVEKAREVYENGVEVYNYAVEYEDIFAALVSIDEEKLQRLRDIVAEDSVNYEAAKSKFEEMKNKREVYCLVYQCEEQLVTKVNGETVESIDTIDLYITEDFEVLSIGNESEK